MPERGVIEAATCARCRDRQRLPTSAARDARPLKRFSPGTFRSRGQIWGWAFATRSFPAAQRWALSLSRALCSPTPLSAACGCFGLMAGPFRSFPIGIYRVRPLRPVRLLPAGGNTPNVVQTRLQFLILRVGTVATGTAPACGRTLAPRYGSDLLTLRLHSLLQWGDAFFHAAPFEEVRGLCQARSLPAITPPLRALLVRASRAFWRGGPAGKRNCVLVCAVATKPSGVTASAHGSKLPASLTLLMCGF